MDFVEKSKFSRTYASIPFLTKAEWISTLVAIREASFAINEFRTGKISDSFISKSRSRFHEDRSTSSEVDNAKSKSNVKIQEYKVGKL
jgi:hypothetical protein